MSPKLCVCSQFDDTMNAVGHVLQLMQSVNNHVLGMCAKHLLSVLQGKYTYVYLYNYIYMYFLDFFHFLPLLPCSLLLFFLSVYSLIIYYSHTYTCIWNIGYLPAVCMSPHFCML